MKLSFAALTDVGKKRKHNEDSHLADGELKLFAVADGMGGHEAGEVASRMAIDVLLHKIVSEKILVDSFIKDRSLDRKRILLDLLEEAAQETCQILYNIARKRDSKHGMGTTLSVLLLAGSSGFVAHVGDSRIYLFRDGEVHQITEDHSLLREQVKRGLLKGKDIDKFKYKNVLTRGVGIHENVQVETLHLEVMPKDRFLLCSDGLHGYFKKDSELTKMLAEPDADILCKNLIDLANSRGGKDNITAVAVDVQEVEMSPGEVEVSRKLEALRRIPLFAKLNYHELVRVLDIAQIKHYEEGARIINEGESGDRMFILINGQVDVEKNGVKLSSIASGGHFGEMALFDDDSRSASVSACTACDLLEISQESFDELLHAESHLAVKILTSVTHVLSQRLRKTSGELSEWHKD